MQLSIGKLATVLIALLITATFVTTAAGLYVLQDNFRTIENQFDAEAHDSVRSAALAIRNQIRFYQGILQLISRNPDVSNLLEFGEHADIVQWSVAIGRLLPGTLGTALTSPQGVVFGDPMALRVGAACQRDMQHFAAGGAIDYPLLHSDVEGFEHFDLLTRVSAPSSESAGTLFVSFRLDILKDILDGMSFQGDRFVLLDGHAEERLQIGVPTAQQQTASYRAKVPDTTWELVLHRPLPASSNFFADLVVADLAILIAVSILMISVARTTHARFSEDMARVHTALEDVLQGRYRRPEKPPAIKEAGILMADIEHLALKIQDQSQELRQLSLSDPLTGIFNRRYFDLMLAHLHEQSRRQRPSTLVVIDLNDFKQVNDEFGHAVGDLVLQETASFLRSRARATDIVARLGGDEFALVLTNMAGDRLEEWLTGLIHDHDHRLLETHDPPLHLCQLSIGVAQIDAHIYPQPADAFNAADSAMYGIKQRRDIRHSRFAIARDTSRTAAVTSLMDAL